MTFLMRLLGHTSSLSSDEERFWTNVYSPVTAAGMRVSADGALKISAAWACGRLIAETVAMLPRIVYQRLGEDAKERATDHPLYGILHDQPNRRQTSFEFIDMLQMHALFRGNGYAKILPGPRGPVDRLIPIHPDRVIPEEIDEDTLRYQVTEKDGSKNIYNDDEIFHLRGLSLDGVTGVSVVAYARESFGLTLAAEHFGAKFFGNYSRPGGYLRHPENLSDEAQKRLISSHEAMHSGDNIHRVGVLEEGMDWVQVSFSPEDSQMLQTRVFQAEDICRWFKVPPVLVGLTTKTTSWGSGVEELIRGYVTFTLMPWLIRWQQLINKDLIIASQKYFVEFLTEALLRGDLEKRYNAYSVGRQGGWLSTNEIRRAENMNPIEDGDDDYLTPLNMRPSDQVENPSGSLISDLAKPNRGPAPSQNNGAHYEQLLYESAARVVRKEVAAMKRAANRNGGPEAWETAVNDFYSTHAEFVSQSMRIPLDMAADYAEHGRHLLLKGGPAVLDTWEAERVQDLVELIEGIR